MKLKKYLEKKGISQAELVRLTEITPALICKYVSGKRTPNLKNAKKIVDATKGEVQWEDLIGKAVTTKH